MVCAFFHLLHRTHFFVWTLLLSEFVQSYLDFCLVYLFIFVITHTHTHSPSFLRFRHRDAMTLLRVGIAAVYHPVVVKVFANRAEEWTEKERDKTTNTYVLMPYTMHDKE